MENAKIAVIEDDESIRGIVRRYANKHGHSIAAEASSLPSAYKIIKKMSVGDLAVDVILLDGDLTIGQNCGEDARHISRLLNQHRLGAYLIGFSAHRMDHLDIKVDFDSQKDIAAAMEAIDNF